MSVNEMIATNLSVRKPFKSVGLICECGNSVTGMEGILSPCSKCGTIYLISVIIIKEKE